MVANGKLVESIVSFGSETTRQTTLLVTYKAECSIILINTNGIRLSDSILGNNIYGSEVLLPVYTTEPKTEKNFSR